jgi:Zn-finger nucleic acid-binding protein
MKCPRCETALLQEQARDGIVIDVCAQCKGIWLDRGELERLIARSAQDMEGAVPARDRERPHVGDHRSHDDHDGDRHDDRYRSEQDGHGGYGAHQPRRKRSWLEGITDIFD